MRWHPPLAVTACDYLLVCAVRPTQLVRNQRGVFQRLELPQLTAQFRYLLWNSEDGTKHKSIFRDEGLVAVHAINPSAEHSDLKRDSHAQLLHRKCLRQSYDAVTYGFAPR